MLSLRCPAEQLEAEWQGGGMFAVGQETEIADAYETFRGAGATRSGARTHREIGSSISVHCCGWNRANET